MIREDRELLAEPARLNGDMASLGMRIMEGSASTAEQAHYAQRLITAGWLTAISGEARVPLANRDGTESRRGRNEGQDAAFVDFLLSSGLRRREAGTLALAELPDRQRGHRADPAHRLGRQCSRPRRMCG